MSKHEEDQAKDVEETELSEGSDLPRDAAPADALSEDVGELREQAQKASEYLDRWQRAAAEIQNLQKRTLQQKQLAVKMAIRELVADMLPSIDNLGRALAASAEGQDPGGLVEGVRLVHGEILRVLERYGIRELTPLGERLNPNHHEAVLRREDPGVEENTVLDVLEKGYLFEDMVIRPARVIVSQAPKEPAPNTSDQENEE